MIENMRKYTGLMAIVFVLLGAGFLFTMNDIGGSSASGSSGPTMLEVYGRSLDHQQYQRMGGSTLQLASETGLHSYINFLIAPDATALQQSMQMGRFGYNFYTMSGGRISDQHLNRFIANRIILQNAMKTMGLYASEEEITETLKASPIFAPNAKGEYDEATYTLFVEKRLGRLGMTEKDLRSLIRESLCLNRLVEITGGGLTAPRTATQERLEADNQTVTLAKIVFNRDDFVEKENPTEEEIKAYWESHQDAYKTDEQRSISYILLQLPKEDQEEDKAEDNKNADKETAQTEEERAAEKEKKEAEILAKAKRAEQRTIAAKGLTREIKDAHQDILDSESNKQPLDFKALMAKRNHTLVSTEMFTRAKLPKELAGLNLRGSSNRNRPLAEDIFSMAGSNNPYDQISDPLPVGENAWIVFQLNDVIEPELLDYTTARVKARANLVGENGTRKVKQAAKDARIAIVKMMEGGKGFDEAAKEKGLNPIQVGPFSLNGTPPKDELAANYFHKVASTLNPGAVSESIDSDSTYATPQERNTYQKHFNDRAVFFYVEKREIEDTEGSLADVDRAVTDSKVDLMFRTYLNWINHQYEQAEVKGLATQNQ